MDIKDKLHQLLNEILSDEYFVVDIQFVVKRPTSKLIVLIDGDKGFDIDTCAEVSRKLSAKLEENDWIEGAYLLEVSSPGIDTPLTSLRQFAKNIGRKLKISLKDGSTITGTLQKVEETQITIEQENAKNKKINPTPVQILFEHIQKTNVLISFN